MFDIFDMFMDEDVLSMKSNYDERKVNNTVVNGLTIDTCSVTDNTKPYETAVRHDTFYDNEWSVVEEYDTKEEAEIGHEKWVKYFENSFPDFIEDISTCRSMINLREVKGKIIHPKIRE